jgi:hypothetical protein
MRTSARARPPAADRGARSDTKDDRAITFSVSKEGIDVPLVIARQ